MKEIAALKDRGKKEKERERAIGKFVRFCWFICSQFALKSHGCV